MFLEVKELQKAATKVLASLDSDTLDVLGSSNVSTYVELVASNGELQLNVTNIEYYARIKLPASDTETFERAVVDAKLFCNLISKVTTESIELQTKDTYLLIKANGSYKLPLIFDDKGLINLPEIKLGEETSEFTLSSDILFSMLAYNSKELKQDAQHPVQKLYYVDDKGCITFTSGACVNNFNLEKPVRLLLNTKLVKLFKLFKEGDVAVKLGHDTASNGSLLTKIRLESDNILITAVTSTTNDYLSIFPVTAVRNQASGTYPYQVNIDRFELVQSLNRLLLFNSTLAGMSKNYGIFKFTNDGVVVYSNNKENFEKVSYKNEAITCDYVTKLDISALKSTLDACSDSILTFNFGNNRSIVLARGNIKNVIPEMPEDFEG